MTNTEFKQWLFSEAGFCGCFAPVDGVILMRDVLQLCHDFQSLEGDEYDRRLSALLPTDGIKHWFLSWLTCLDLLMHGCTLRYSWTTQTGDEMLEYLNSIPDEILMIILDE